MNTTLVSAPTLTRQAQSWVSALDAEGKSPATVRAYRQGIQGFITWHTSSFPDAVPVLDAAVVRLYLSALREAGQRPGTRRLRYAALRLFSKWLTSEGAYEKDPLLGMEPPKLDKPEVHAVPDDELAALLRACEGKTFADKRDTALVRLFISTGMRASEAVHLTTASVDARAQTVTVKHGKGGKDRRVPLLPETSKALTAYLRARKRHPQGKSSALWLGDTGRSFGYDGCAKALGRRAQAAGIQGFHIHRLRHSFACRWLTAGGSEDALMAIAGWSSRDMIQRYGATNRANRALDEARRLGLDKL